MAKEKNQKTRKYVFISPDPLSRICIGRTHAPGPIEGQSGDVFDLTPEDEKLGVIAMFIANGKAGHTDRNRFEPVEVPKASKTTSKKEGKKGKR